MEVRVLRWLSAVFIGVLRATLMAGTIYVMAWVAMALLFVRRLVEERHDRAIPSCHLLPPALHAKAKSVGKICCLGPANC